MKLFFFWHELVTTAIHKSSLQYIPYYVLLKPATYCRFVKHFVFLKNSNFEIAMSNGTLNLVWPFALWRCCCSWWPHQRWPKWMYVLRFVKRAEICWVPPSAKSSRHTINTSRTKVTRREEKNDSITTKTHHHPPSAATNTIQNTDIRFECNRSLTV